MTILQAKNLIKNELEKRSLPFTKLTAKTINFIDLGREEKLFIKIHGWKGNIAWKEIQQIAKENNFLIEV